MQPSLHGSDICRTAPSLKQVVEHVWLLDSPQSRSENGFLARLLGNDSRLVVPVDKIKGFLPHK